MSVGKVVIVGGGISGLSTAYYLAKAGVRSTIIESRPRLGGVICTEHVDDCLIEAGPDSFLAAKPAAMDLIRELGLANEVIGSNDHKRVTFVRKNGRLVPLPDGLMMMVPTKIMPLVTTPLVGWGTKFRMGMEWFRAPKAKPDDQSVAEFVREHYGTEAVDYLAEPLLSGIYGGDPAQLSVRSVLPRFVDLATEYGSLTRGVLASRARAPKPQGAPAPLFRTLKGGLTQMVDAVTATFGDQVDILQTRAEAVERNESGFRIRTAAFWVEAQHLVLACEAHSAAPLAAACDPRLAELLGEIGYGSSITVAIGYDAADFNGKPPVGFGFLVPRKERRKLAACTWIGTKFPFRVPEGKIVARCFIGGAEAVSSLQQSDAAIAAEAAAELREIAGVQATPKFSRVYKWPSAMAQYPVGHPKRLAEIEARTAAISGLHLAGNAYEGIGIPDCIRMGKRAAEKILGNDRAPARS
ncbi:MAG TPA: protoporphyrinogen oxidase [Candidatus Limnocylindrales bacterium]|nr:protoporphyrinogen oxidase [Candidatus Limnocylindrales bacterium]